MMKSIAPLWERLRHVHRPQVFRTHSAEPEADRVTAGQRLAELVAAFVGSWWFLGGQAFFLFLWLIYNTLQFTTHFDPPPYILLNLLLSFQAAFTGPVLLIAANVGAVRDHQQADRIEHLGQQNEQLTGQNEQLVQRLLNMEEILELHVAQSLKAHGDELQHLGALMREVHATLCPPGAASVAAVGADPDGSGAEAEQEPERVRTRTRPRGRSDPSQA